MPACPAALARRETSASCRAGASPNIGLASAVCIFIFFIVAAMSYSGFARTKSLEEVN